MKVYLDSDDYKHKKEIIELIDREIKYNPDFSGISYQIVKDDCTWVENIDEINGTILLTRIENKVEELTYPD